MKKLYDAILILFLVNWTSEKISSQTYLDAGLSERMLEFKEEEFKTIIKSKIPAVGICGPLKDKFDKCASAEKDSVQPKASAEPSICFSYADENTVKIELARPFYVYDFVLEKVYDHVRNEINPKFALESTFEKFCQDSNDEIDSTIAKIIFEKITEIQKSVADSKIEALKNVSIEVVGTEGSLEGAVKVKLTGNDEDATNSLLPIFYSISKANPESKKPNGLAFSTLYFSSQLEFTLTDKHFIEEETARLLIQSIKKHTRISKFVNSEIKGPMLATFHTLKCEHLVELFKSGYPESVAHSGESFPFTFSCKAPPIASLKPQYDEVTSKFNFELTCEFVNPDPKKKFSNLRFEQKQPAVVEVYNVSLLEESFYHLVNFAYSLHDDISELMGNVCLIENKHAIVE